MVIAPKPGVVRKAMEAKKAQVAAQMAAEAAKKNHLPGKGPQPVAPPPEDDELDVPRKQIEDLRDGAEKHDAENEVP